MRLLINALFLALILVLCGCTPWATYPPIEGAAGLSNPALAPIPTLMAEAIRYTHEKDGGEEGDIVFNLPPDISAKVYDKVMDKLEGSAPLLEPDPKAYHVYMVRIRTVDAEVDVIHPGPGDVPQLTTVTFKQNLIKGWRIVRHRDWGGRVEEIPAPGYVPPEEDEAEEAPEGGEEAAEHPEDAEG